MRGWSAASLPACRRTCARSPRCSSPAGIAASPTRFRPAAGTSSASRSRKAVLQGVSRSARQRPLAAARECYGARPQRLLFASTSTKDPKAPDTLYVDRARRARTRSTPCRRRRCTPSADHGTSSGVVPRDGGDGEQGAREFERAGIDVDALGETAAGRRRQGLRRSRGRICSAPSMRKSKALSITGGRPTDGRTLADRLAAWQALPAHQRADQGRASAATVRRRSGPRRSAYSVEGAGLFLDYSKNRITDETVRLLLRLAEERGVAARRDAMFRGEKINTTEQRAVLHVALRAPRDAHIEVDGKDVVPDVHEVLDRMATFADAGALRHVDAATPASASATSSISGSAARISGRKWPIARCGRSATASMTFRFVSNVDGADLHRGNTRISMRRRRCSSSRRRPSPRSRR